MEEMLLNSNNETFAVQSDGLFQFNEWNTRNNNIFHSFWCLMNAIQSLFLEDLSLCQAFFQMDFQRDYSKIDGISWNVFINVVVPGKKKRKEWNALNFSC